MLSWKKSCVALAFAGVVSSSVLHSQLLAAGKKRAISDYQQSPSMDRIRGKLLDRYGSMIPEGPTPAQGSATHARMVHHNPVTADQVVATPPKGSLPVSASPSPRVVNVPTQAILPEEIAITEHPKLQEVTPARPGPVLTESRATAAPPKAPAPVAAAPRTPTTTWKPKSVASTPAVTTPATGDVSRPQPAAWKQVVEEKKPAVVRKETKESLPTLPEIAVETASSREKETYYPGLIGRSPTVVPTSPLPVPQEAVARQTVVTTSKLPPVAPAQDWKKSESTAPTVPVTLPKIDEPSPVATSEAPRLPHHRPASPPTSGQRTYQPKMVDNVASPIVKSASSPSQPVAMPSVAVPEKGDAVVEVEKAKKIVEPTQTREMPLASAPLPPAPVVPAPVKEEGDTQKKRRLLPVTTVQTNTTRPIVPEQPGRATALKRTRSLMNPGETTFEPAKEVAATKTAAPESSPVAKREESSPAAAAPAKVVASESSYASRIASTYEQVVTEGKQPMAPMVAPPEPRRASLPGHAALQKSREATEKPEEVRSATFPVAKGEAPSKPVEAVPAVSKAVPPSTKLPSEPAAPTSTGLSFVIERARQGALLDTATSTPVVASNPTPPVHKEAKGDLPAPSKVAPAPPSMMAPPSMPVVVEKVAPKPTSTEPTSTEPTVAQVPAPAAPEKIASKPVATKVNTTKPVWSAPKIGMSKAPPSVDPINPYREEVISAKPVVHEVQIEKLPTVSTASAIPTSTEEKETAPVTQSGPKPAMLPKLPDPVAHKRSSSAPVKGTTESSATSTKVALVPLETKVSPTTVAKPAASETGTPTSTAAASRSKVPESSKVDVAAIHAHLEVLRRGGIDQERQKALQAIASTPGWETVKTVGPVLRNIAMTDYNTHLRLSAVQMLGKMNADRRMVVEALHISAEYDSDVTIRSTALRLLDQIAAAPAASQLR